LSVLVTDPVFRGRSFSGLGFTRIFGRVPPFFFSVWGFFFFPFVFRSFGLWMDLLHGLICPERFSFFTGFSSSCASVFLFGHQLWTLPGKLGVWSCGALT